MYFRAKLCIKSEESAVNLIQAFFKAFNSQSGIEIMGHEARIKIFFDDTPPMEYITSFKGCKVEEFHFGKVCEEDRKGEPKQADNVVADEELFQQTEQFVAEEENPEHPKQSKERRRTENKRAMPAKAGKVEKAKVCLLEEIVQKSASFEHFVKLVAERLEMDKRQEFFISLVAVATEIKKMSWKEIEKALNEKGVNYSKWDISWTRGKVNEKLKEYSITLLPLLNAIVQYQDYSFRHEQHEEISSEQAGKDNTGKDEEATQRKGIKMECMPEIPHFEEILGSVDKALPIEERVRYVLESMGLERKGEREQKEILEIATTAMKIQEMTFDRIFMRVKIPKESALNARMSFSQFVNDFVKKYDSERKVKLLDFLKQLQEIIMDEKEGLSDSIN